MANQIQIRPWSRLASLRTPEPSLKATNTSSHDNIATATKSPPITPTPHVHSPMHSQNLKRTTPVTFPPSKLMAHPQQVEEVTIEKPNGNVIASLKKEPGGTQKQGIGHDEKEVTNKENETKGKGIHTKISSSEDHHGIRVITISGENRGAEMQITKSQKKPNHKSEKVKTQSSPPMRALYANSNVQCVNNSMVLNTSLSHHDPGVHLIIPKKPFGQGFHLKKCVDGQRN